MNKSLIFKMYLGGIYFSFNFDQPNVLYNFIRFKTNIRNDRKLIKPFNKITTINEMY